MFVDPELLQRIESRLDVAGRSNLQWVPVYRDWNTYRNETYLLFEAGASRPSLVVKASGDRAELEIEHDNLELLTRGATPDFCESVPNVVEFRQIGDRWFLVQTVVPGRLLTTDLHRMSREGAFFRRVMTDATSWLFDFHRRLGVADVPATDLADRFGKAADAYLDRFDVSDRCRAWIEESRWVLDDESIAPAPMVASHGDFCPANLLLNGTRVGVIDWELPIRREIAPTDLLHFIHSYSLETTGNEIAYLDRLERLMFGHDPAARAVTECLDRYRREFPTDDRVLDVLPTLFWMESASYKAEYFDRAPEPNPGYCGYMILDGRRCVNLERLCARGWTE